MVLCPIKFSSQVLQCGDAAFDLFEPAARFPAFA
jgi:hypothetical protein